LSTGVYQPTSKRKSDQSESSTDRVASGNSYVSTNGDQIYDTRFYVYFVFTFVTLERLSTGLFYFLCTILLTVMKHILHINRKHMILERISVQEENLLFNHYFKMIKQKGVGH